MRRSSAGSVPAGLCGSAALRSPCLSTGCRDTLSLTVSLGSFIFKDAGSLRCLMPLVTQQPLPSSPVPRRERRCPRREPPVRCSGSPGCGPSSSSPQNAGPEPWAAMEAGQVLRCKQSTRGPSPSAPQSSPSRRHGGCC